MNQTLYTFGYPETLLKEYDHWAVFVRANHVTLGSLVIIAKSEATNLGNLSKEEWAEFATVSNEMENLLRKTFGAEKFNYLALMMVDPHVHFHFIPRYSKPVTFNDRVYTDPDWPVKTELKTIETTEEEIKTIQNYLLTYLS